ncbi:MAG: hypothetical protein RL134_618 [Actinomycetota bacterium]|jgi:hypothetical protein
MPEPGVNVSLDEMYRLLLQVDHKVTTLTTSAAATQVSLTDHESRIRAIEAAADNGLRVTAMEEDVKAIRAELESMKVKVYSIPGASVVIATAAVVLTLIRTF